MSIPLTRPRPRQKGIEGPWFHADYKVDAILSSLNMTSRRCWKVRGFSQGHKATEDKSHLTTVFS